MVLDNVAMLNHARGNSVVISTYYNDIGPHNEGHLTALVNQPTVSLPLSQAAIDPLLYVGISVLCYCLSHYPEHLSLFPMILCVCGDSTHIPTNFRYYNSVSVTYISRHFQVLVGVTYILLPCVAVQPGILTKLESEYEVRTYYDVFKNGSVRQHYVGRDLNSRGGQSSHTCLFP